MPPDYLLRSHHKIINNIAPLKHSSDMNLMKKKTNVEYRIKKLSKSPHKTGKDLQLQNSHQRPVY